MPGPPQAPFSLNGGITTISYLVTSEQVLSDHKQVKYQLGSRENTFCVELVNVKKVQKCFEKKTTPTLRTESGKDFVLIK